MNGLKHGLRAETLLLPGESEEVFQCRLDDWTVDLDARTDVERYQAEKAVAASWRLDRCLRSETALMTDRVLAAAAPDPERAEAKARRLGARLGKDPADVAHKLRKTSAGIRWMLQRWDELAETLDQTGFWEQSRLHLALGLLGFTAQEWRDERRVAAVVIAYLSARRGESTNAADVRFATGGQPEAMSPGEYERESETMAAMATAHAKGRADLRGAVAEARADLLARLEWVEEREARKRATAADRAAIDDSAEGQRRLRYEAMHARELRAALRDLRAEQARRMTLGEVTTTAPTEPTAGPDQAGSPPASIAPTEPTETPDRDAPSEPTEPAVSDENNEVESTCTDQAGPTAGASGDEAGRAPGQVEAGDHVAALADPGPALKLEDLGNLPQGDGRAAGLEPRLGLAM
jgi:hypothetical protein